MAQSSNIRPFRIAALTTALVAALALALVASPAASAGSPAFCQQYPNAPECEGDVGPGGGADEDSAGAGAGPSGDGVGNAGGGELPFTGYPLTPLVLLLLALLAAGLMIRSYLAIRDRLAAGRAASS